MARLNDLSGDQIQRVPLFSAQLGLRRWLAVQLPPGFEPGQAVPIVYLWRGHHSEWYTPRQDLSRQEPFPDAARRAMREGRLAPVVLAMPCLASDDRSFQTLGADWSAPHLAPAAAGMGLGRFEQHLVSELIPQLERALGLDQPRRFGIGFGLGGLTLFALGWRHPGLFEHMAAYDGSFFREPIDPNDRILSHEVFDPVFGSGREPAQVRSHSPLWLARNLSLEALQKSRYYLQSGPPEAEPDDANHDRTLALAEALAARGTPNQVPQVVPGAHHDWRTADEFALRVLAMML